MKKLLITLSFLIPLGIFAQEKDKKVYKGDFELGQYAPMTVSYFGNFIAHPGVKVAFDWNLLMLEKTIEKKRKIKTVRKVLLVSPSVAYYYHKDSHMGLILSTDLIWRRYTKKLYLYDVGIGAAYYRKFNLGDTWETNEDGTASNVGSTSNGYFSPSLSFSFGKRFMLKDTTPLDAFARLNSNFLLDYNAGFVAELSLELGARMTFNWGIKRGDVKTTAKSKS